MTVNQQIYSLGSIIFLKGLSDGKIKLEVKPTSKKNNLFLFINLEKFLVNEKSKKSIIKNKKQKVVLENIFL